MGVRGLNDSSSFDERVDDTELRMHSRIKG